MRPPPTGGSRTRFRVDPPARGGSILCACQRGCSPFSPRRTPTRATRVDRRAPRPAELGAGPDPRRGDALALALDGPAGALRRCAIASGSCTGSRIRWGCCALLAPGVACWSRPTGSRATATSTRTRSRSSGRAASTPATSTSTGFGAGGLAAIAQLAGLGRDARQRRRHCVDGHPRSWDADAGEDAGPLTSTAKRGRGKQWRCLLEGPASSTCCLGEAVAKRARRCFRPPAPADAGTRAGALA